MPDEREHLPRHVVAGSLFGFVVLGLPDGMLGVAWPALRHSFHQPLGSLGELLLGSLAGYMVVTAITGWALRRMSTAEVLLVSAVVASAGAAVFVYARWWGALFVGVLLLGAAGGGLDAALNTAVALASRPRFMNLLHGAYGVGAALGPLVVTAALALSSWRSAYGVLLAFEIILVLVWLSLRHRFSSLSGHSDRAVKHISFRTRALRDRKVRLLLALSLAVFFFYTGIEVSVASWSASFLRGPGGVSVRSAGITVFAYWISLTAGRFATAALGPRLSPASAVRAGVLGSILGAGILWLHVSDVADVVGLVVMGLSLGPIFPALVNLTPERLGRSAALDAVGWELSAAGVGGSGLSALVGVVLQLDGLRIFGAALMSLAVLFGCLNMLLDRMASRA
jgi:fucose permease